MLLRMLGYTEEDVGPFWPADYIAKAQAVGLTEGVSVTDAKSAVKRSDAAILLLNTLNAPLKDDAGATLMDNLASATVDGGILLATSETDSSLAANEALFFEDGAARVTRWQALSRRKTGRKAIRSLRCRKAASRPARRPSVPAAMTNCSFLVPGIPLVHLASCGRIYRPVIR